MCMIVCVYECGVCMFLGGVGRGTQGFSVGVIQVSYDGGLYMYSGQREWRE